MPFALFFFRRICKYDFNVFSCNNFIFRGWLAPFNLEILNFLPGQFWFILKVTLLLFVFIWVRATLPRYRYDQLMRLGWKIFLPFSLFWLVITLIILFSFNKLPL